MQYAGPFGRGVLLHAQAPTHTHTHGEKHLEM